MYMFLREFPSIFATLFIFRPIKYKNAQSVYRSLLSTVPNFCQYSGPESQGATKTRRMRLFSTGYASRVSVFTMCSLNKSEVKYFINGIVQLFLLHGFLLFHDCPENIINLSLTHAIFTAVIFGRYFILEIFSPSSTNFHFHLHKPTLKK